jgi:hypothetical protein
VASCELDIHQRLTHLDRACDPLMPQSVRPDRSLDFRAHTGPPDDPVN